MPESAAEPTKARQINLRVTFEEEAAIQHACEVLGDVTTSSLVSLGLIQAVTDLGMLLGDDEPPRLKSGYIWPFTPRRPDGESARSRITVYLQSFLYPTVELAAWAVHLSVPIFAIGSALRYLALLKLANERRRRHTPLTFNPGLAKLSIPYDFDELVQSTRR